MIMYYFYDVDRSRIGGMNKEKNKQSSNLKENHFRNDESIKPPTMYVTIKKKKKNKKRNILFCMFYVSSTI